MIDCLLKSLNNGSLLEFTNPTCNQLQIGPSPLHTLACAGIPLQPNMLTTAGSVTCSPCDLGMHGPNGSTVTGGTNVQHPHGTCVQCQAGRYSDVPGLAECKGCPAGSVTKDIGSLTCTQCGPGRYAADKAQLECAACPPGRFQQDQSGVSCEPCPTGLSSGGGARRCSVLNTASQ